jgi:hypothetical protein
MPGNDLTRRSLLALVAGASAASAVDPRGSAAAVLRGEIPSMGGSFAAASPRLFTLGLGSLRPGVRTVRAPRRFDLAGLAWSGPAAPHIEIRTMRSDGRWGGWANAGATGHRPAGAEAAASPTGDLVGEPVWVGASEVLQIRLAQPVEGVALHLVDAAVPRRGALAGALDRAAGATHAAGALDRAAGATQAAGAAGALPLATPALEAGSGQPPIVARRAWAGRDSPPRVAPEYGDVQLGFVHHTENPNGYAAAEVPAMLRAIYVFHRYVNGWNDIGYNFVLDLFGRIFEARAGGIDEPVVGAQAGGYNAVSTGVAVLGDFQEAPISNAARQALEKLLAWKLSLHGVPVQGHVQVRVDPAGAVYSRFPADALVTLPRVAGHRDADATACPGDVLYGELAAIRHGAATLAGTPARATIELASPTLLAGRLARLDGSPIEGAPVQVQQRAVSERGQAVRERTLASVITDAEGNWTLPVGIVHPQALHPRHVGHGKRRHVLPEPVAALRALCPGGGGLPATVSPPLEIRGDVTVGQETVAGGA